MKLLTAIIVSFAILIPSIASGIQVKPADEQYLSDMQREPLAAGESWLTGTATEITKQSLLINGDSYRLAKNVLVRYPNGKKVRSFSMLKKAAAVYVTARVAGGTVKELIVEGRRLKH